MIKSLASLFPGSNIYKLKAREHERRLRMTWQSTNAAKRRMKKRARVSARNVQTDAHLTSFDVQIQRVKHWRQEILFLHLKQRRGSTERARLDGRESKRGRMMLL